MIFRKELDEEYLIERTIDTPNGPLVDASGNPIEIPDEQANNKPKRQSTPRDILSSQLLTKEQQKEFEKDNTSVIDMLTNGKVKYFEDFKDWNRNLQQKTIDSIVKKGIIYKNNPFLRYAKYIAGSPVTKSSNLTPAILSTIEKAAEQDDRSFIYTNKNLRGNKYNQWVTDPNSYEADDPVYKIKTLLFLTGRDVSNFGDTKTVPIEDVKNSKKKDEIIKTISRWQTKNGVNPAPDSSKPGSGEVKNPDNDKKSPKVGKKTESSKKFETNIGGDRGTITIKRSDLLKYFNSGNVSAEDTLNNAYAKMFKYFIINPNTEQQAQQRQQTQTQQPAQRQNNRQQQ